VIVAVVGAAGQLGRVTAERWSAGHRLVALTRADVDLTDAAALEARLDAVGPELIVNCAAYNNVDGAEDDARTALAVNAMAVRSLAAVAVRSGAVLVHYSTDFVFDGTASEPYTEEDRPRPQSVYAASKLLGEWLAADAPRHYVLRVESLFGGIYVRGSVDRIAAAIRRGEESPVFVDRIVSPSYVHDVVTATETLVLGGASPGLYHCVNTGSTTWLELAEEIARRLGKAGAARLRPMKVSEVTTRAKRPQYCALSNAKLRAAGVEMPGWQDAVGRYLDAGGS
jgi:dTDP-4-dehydrorhamnose reductase